MENSIEYFENLLSEKGINFERTADQRLLARCDHRDDHGHTYQKIEIYRGSENTFRANFFGFYGDNKYNEDPTEMIEKFHQQKITFFSEQY